MQQIGYSLVDAAGTEVSYWGDVADQCPGIPNPIVLPNGDAVHSLSCPADIGEWRFVQRHLAYGASASTSLTEAGVVVTRVLSNSDLKAYASNKRWEIEISGVLVGGMLVPTDDRSKAMIARAARTSSGVASTPFIVSGVNYGSITKAQFEAIDAAIDDHIASTFSKLATILAGIDATEITTRAQIDAAFVSV